MSEKGDVMPAEAGVMCFELGGRGHEPRSVGSCCKLPKAGDELFPRACRRNIVWLHLEFSP